MGLEIAAITVLTLALLLLALISIRNVRVYKLRTRLLREELAWLSTHTHPSGKSFARYESLPSYCTMVLSIWKPLRAYEEALKPLESYYSEEGELQWKL